MKSKYIIPRVEQLEFDVESRFCALSGKKNEPFSDADGGGFDF